MQRVTQKDLDGIVRVLNKRAGFADQEVWNTVNGRNVATVGMYYVDGAYGGWALHLIVSDGGGVSDVFRSGHMPARELYGRISAYLDGMEATEGKMAQRMAQDGGAR